LRTGFAAGTIAKFARVGGEQLANRDAIEAYVSEYNAERRRLARASGDKRKHLERRAGEVRRELERAVEMLLKGLCDPETLRATIRGLETERDDIARQLATMQDEGRIIALHPAAVKRYLADVERLTEVLADNAAGQSDELIAIVRRLISTVTVHAKPGGGPVTIEFRGRLSELIDAPDADAFRKRSIGGYRW